MYIHDPRRAGLEDDGVARLKRGYSATGASRSNKAHGFVLAG